MQKKQSREKLRAISVYIKKSEKHQRSYSFANASQRPRKLAPIRDPCACKEKTLGTQLLVPGPDVSFSKMKVEKRKQE